MATLYHETLRHFRRGSEKPVLKTERIKNTKKDALNLLNNNSHQNNVHKIWESIGDGYFLRHNPDEIAWHTKGILDHNNINKPLVMVNRESSRGGSLVFVYMKDKKNIFAVITKAIANIGLTILDARIITNHENFTFDTFVVLENNGKIITSKSRCNEIKNKILQELSLPHNFPKKGKIIQKRQLKSFLIPTQVLFETDEKNNRTIMEIITIDRPSCKNAIDKKPAQLLEKSFLDFENDTQGQFAVMKKHSNLLKMSSPKNIRIEEFFRNYFSQILNP